MKGRSIGWLASLVLLGWGLVAGRSDAGSILACLCPDKDCPRPSYSRLHYWTPTLYRIHDCFCGQRLPCIPDRYPEIPPRFDVLRFPCPAVDPSVLYQNRSADTNRSDASRSDAKQ